MRVATVMLIVGLVVAANVLAWQFRDEPNRDAICFGMVLCWSTICRWPGAWMGARIGVVARHAMAWFFAVIAGTVTICVLNVLERPESFAKDFRDGLFAFALIYSLVVATLIETFLGPIEFLRQERVH